MKLHQNTKLAGRLFMRQRSTSLGLIIILLAHSAVLLAAPDGFRPPKINVGSLRTGLVVPLAACVLILSLLLFVSPSASPSSCRHQ